MKTKIDKIIPKYAYIPLIMMVVLNILTYNVSKLITNHFYHYNAAIFVDNYIPFLAIFISIYILSYLQWFIGFIVIFRENESTCYRVCAAELVAKFLCMFFFFVFPTTLIRPTMMGNGIWEALTEFIYNVDAPVNLFPSIHCLESWICFRGSMYLNSVSKEYKIGMFIFTILVCLSTVFVKQHVFIDIIGGMLVVEIGLFLSRKFNLGKVIERINNKLCRRS